VSTPPTAPRRAVAVGHAPAIPAPRLRTTGEPRHRAVRWPQRYAALVRTADLVLLVVVVAAGAVLIHRVLRHPGALACGTAGAAALVVIAALAAARAWEPVVLGAGPTEFSRVVRAVGLSAVTLAIAGLALGLDDVVRPWVFGVLPAYGLAAVLQRYALRTWLHRQRRARRFQLPVLAVGSYEAVAGLIGRTRRDPTFGWTVTGACTSTGTGPHGAPDIDGVPVVGDLESVPAAVWRTGYRVVAVAPGPGWGPRRLHELAWQLEGTRTELAVDPGLMEVGGPRLHLAPVDHMPLVVLCRPRLAGGRRLLKAVFDAVAATALLTLLAVPLLVVAVLVRQDGGPALRRERRIGEGGRPYAMTRFRTSGADGHPTRVGRVLLRYSIHELPQLLDVLAGTMSLVGPRPPRPEEVAGADVEAMRRLLVRPGMTGPCRVLRDHERTGRDESMRLDLRYVENWSLALDLAILARTARSLLRRARASA
jgi:lipopolysaccharide/colanic/teichoic acid biosynthesis glycosyltransferase